MWILCSPNSHLLVLRSRFFLLHLRHWLHTPIPLSQSYTNVLTLNGTIVKHCISDVEQILMGQGANVGLQQICSIHSSNLTEATCPVKNVNEFHDLVDTSKLLTACENIDLVNECCYQICQSIILEATSAIASKGSDLLDTGVRHILPEHSIRVNDCRNIVLRWVASKLDPSHAKKVLRGLSNCKVNTAYPLLFPDMNNVAKVGGDGISNKSAVVMPWKAMCLTCKSRVSSRTCKLWIVQML